MLAIQQALAAYTGLSGRLPCQTARVEARIAVQRFAFADLVWHKLVTACVVGNFRVGSLKLFSIKR
jgi:hypothetical protein